MEFKVNGRTSKVPFDKNSKNASGKHYTSSYSYDAIRNVKTQFHRFISTMMQL